MSSPHTPDKFSREDEALARHREELRNRFPLPNPKPRKPRKALATTALLIALGAGLAWIDPAYQSEHYSSAIGEQRTVDLADGSRMTLDSNTQVTVDWHLRSRHVALQGGQALFDVSKTVVRPFQVDAGAVQVKVLGTLFSVRNTADDVRVTLVRGSVQVHSTTGGQAPVRLVPGQQVDARQGQLLRPVTVDAESAIAWKDNRLVFDRTPLAEALAQIQRYRKPAIRLDDPTLASLPITGVFDTRNVEDLLGLLPSILPLSMSNDAQGNTHFARRLSKK